jgi:hypothetical protein
VETEAETLLNALIVAGGTGHYIVLYDLEPKVNVGLAPNADVVEVGPNGGAFALLNMLLLLEVELAPPNTFFDGSLAGVEVPEALPNAPPVLPPKEKAGFGVSAVVGFPVVDPNAPVLPKDPNAFGGSLAGVELPVEAPNELPPKLKVGLGGSPVGVELPTAGGWKALLPPKAAAVVLAGVVKPLPKVDPPISGFAPVAVEPDPKPDVCPNAVLVVEDSVVDVDRLPPNVEDWPKAVLVAVSLAFAVEGWPNMDFGTASVEVGGAGLLPNPPNIGFGAVSVEDDSVFDAAEKPLPKVLAWPNTGFGVELADPEVKNGLEVVLSSEGFADSVLKTDDVPVPAAERAPLGTSGAFPNALVWPSALVVDGAPKAKVVGFAILPLDDEPPPNAEESLFESTTGPPKLNFGWAMAGLVAGAATGFCSLFSAGLPNVPKAGATKLDVGFSGAAEPSTGFGAANPPKLNFCAPSDLAGSDFEADESAWKPPSRPNNEDPPEVGTAGCLAGWEGAGAGDLAPPKLKLNFGWLVASELLLFPVSALAAAWVWEWEGGGWLLALEKNGLGTLEALDDWAADPACGVAGAGAGAGATEGIPRPPNVGFSTGFGAVETEVGVSAGKVGPFFSAAGETEAEVEDGVKLWGAGKVNDALVSGWETLLSSGFEAVAEAVKAGNAGGFAGAALLAGCEMEMDGIAGFVAAFIFSVARRSSSFLWPLASLSFIIAWASSSCFSQVEYCRYCLGRPLLLSERPRGRFIRRESVESRRSRKIPLLGSLKGFSIGGAFVEGPTELYKRCFPFIGLIF